jgi:hypothetical protein
MWLCVIESIPSARFSICRYAFGPEVAIMASAVFTWGVTLIIYYCKCRHRYVRLFSRATMTSALILYPTALACAVSLLNCRTVTMTSAALKALDSGGSVSSAVDSYTTVSVSVLVSNPFFVCWADGGAHRPAAIFACVALALFGALLPLISLMWIWQDEWLAKELARSKAQCSDAPLNHAISESYSAAASQVAAIEASRAISPDQLVVPLFDDYHAPAWYVKFFDLLLLAIFATTEAMLSRPASRSDIAAKAILISVPSLAMAVIVAVVRPFPKMAMWQTWVRVWLLLISTGCAVLNAMASAIDIGWGDANTLTALIIAGSYALFVGCCLIALQLIVGFIRALVAAARDERNRTSHEGLSATDRPVELKGADLLYAAPISRVMNPALRDEDIESSRVSADVKSSSVVMISTSSPSRHYNVPPVSHVQNVNFDCVREHDHELLFARGGISDSPSAVSSGRTQNSINVSLCSNHSLCSASPDRQRNAAASPAFSPPRMPRPVPQQFASGRTVSQPRAKAR